MLHNFQIENLSSLAVALIVMQHFENIKKNTYKYREDPTNDFKFD